MGIDTAAIDVINVAPVFLNQNKEELLKKLLRLIKNTSL
jgi:hypothetical protein